MKLLLDEGLPASAGRVLADMGIDAVHTQDAGLSAWPDDRIIDWCRAEGRLIVALDGDFHSILARSKETTPSVIRIRIEGLKGDALAALVMRVLALAGEDLQAGALVTVQPSRVRVHRLPV